MREEQINALAKYLGCKFEYKFGDYLINDDRILDNWFLVRILQEDTKINSLELHLKDISSLTQEDFDRMSKVLRS